MSLPAPLLDSFLPAFDFLKRQGASEMVTGRTKARPHNFSEIGRVAGANPIP